MRNYKIKKLKNSMRVWPITTQKGGVGKTVLTTNLAVEAGRHREKVLIIDLDPQASSTKWWESRDADTPLLINCTYNLLRENIEKAQEKGFTLVIIDTAGRESLHHTEAIDLATFCIVPCQPSKDDIRSTLPTIDLIKSKKRNFAFVISRCPFTGSDQKEARTTLSTLGTVCKTACMERKCFKRAYGNDQAVIEYNPSDKGAGEITQIFKWFKQKENRLS